MAFESEGVMDAIVKKLQLSGARRVSELHMQWWALYERRAMCRCALYGSRTVCSCALLYGSRTVECALYGSKTMGRDVHYGLFVPLWVLLLYHCFVALGP